MFWELTEMHKQKIHVAKCCKGIPAKCLVESAKQTGIVPKYVGGIALHNAGIYSIIVQVTQLKLPTIY